MSRWLKMPLLTLAALGAIAITLPWWLGSVLRPVLRGQGVTFKRYERVDYAHFRLHEVAYVGAGFGIGADRVQGVTPLVWFWQRARGLEPNLTVENWRLVRTANADKPAGTARIRGLPDLRNALARVGPRLHYWLPRVQLAGGDVRGFGPEILIARADWQNTALTVDGLEVVGRRLAFTLAPAANGSVTLDAHTADHDATLRLVWRDTTVTGEASLWDQPLALAARFPNAGWLPAEASATAENWRLPAARVKLSAPYAQVSGGARLVWRDEAFDVSLDARAEPAAGAAKAPPFSARAAAHGTFHELTVTTLDVQAPFATAKLSAPLTIDLNGRRPAASARLSVQADLSKQPWIEARGRAEGSVTVTGDTDVARQEFALNFSDVAFPGFSLKAAQARGALAWPRLELTALSARLDDKSSVEAHGAVDWQARELTGVAVTAKLDAAAFARWMPAGVEWKSAEITATASGPLDAPRHQGFIQVGGACLPPVRPLSIEASWKGTGGQAEVCAKGVTERATMELAGTLERHALWLEKLQLVANNNASLELTTPARVTWSPVWRTESLVLNGSAGELTLKGEGGANAFFVFSADRLSSERIQDWVELTGPRWQVEAARATGRVDNGVVAFDCSVTGQIDMAPEPAQVSLVARGDAHGVELKDFKVMSAGRVLTQATGRVPLLWRAEPMPGFSLDETAALELSATTEEDSPLWATLAGLTGLEIGHATARANLKGSLREPAGELQVKVARVSAAPGRHAPSMPQLTDLDVGVQFARERITVKNFTAKLDGQALQASGQLPMDDRHWLQLWRAPKTFDWRKAEAKIEIPDADLAPLAQRFPTWVAAQGRLRAHVAMDRGGKLSGELQLTDAASRPLPPLGTLQDVQAHIRLDDRTITVQKLTASLGGEPVALDGNVSLDPDGTPRLALGLKGKNLPLVRNTGLLLRTDLDLRAETPASGPTRLSGAIIVRDCLVLANVNLQALLPGGLRGVARQPPYFSVEAAPFNQWPLAVTVRAPSAVRVRTTVYNGTASALFQLGGTLGEPRAVGELTVDQGQVLFPFATFKVQQGAVRLREEDPFHAVVNLNAASQRRDYQLRLEMTGELPTPNVVLTSTPAMEAADVLLMVMTGQPPASETATATTATSAGPRLAMLGAYLGRGLFQDLGFGGEDRLEISAGERISRDGRETYEFEYKLGGRWSLQGEYDQFDSYNAGLKWRAYAEESKPREKK